MNTLEVVIHGLPAGKITAIDGASRYHVQPAVFTYYSDYLAREDVTPLSVSIPLEAGEHEVGPWIDGLLPDNPLIRERWQREYDLESLGAVDLLGSPVGWDCAGAVQFCRKEELSTMLARGGGTNSLTKSNVATIIQRLKQTETAWSSGRRDGAFSLAGAQSKLALCYHEGDWSIPYGITPTTHILKPSIPNFPDQHIIEHLSQRTATLLGIESAKTQCIQIKGQQALLVERYDRVATPNDEYVRIHQEDMCQALQIEPNRKYQSDGGPGVEAIATILHTKSSTQESDIRLFRDALIYNWLIVGTDAHGKNYGLMLTQRLVRMTPLYDMCSILPYREDLDKKSMRNLSTRVSNYKLAMKIGRDYSIYKSDYRRAWERTARLLRLPEAEVISRATELAVQLPEALETAVAELPRTISKSSYVEKLREEVEQRAMHCRYLDRMTEPSVQGRFDFDARLTKHLQPRQPGDGARKQSSLAGAGRQQQCGHIGVRSGTRCRLPVNHKSSHRY